jgi:hypothetical protein
MGNRASPVDMALELLKRASWFGPLHSPGAPDWRGADSGSVNQPLL